MTHSRRQLIKGTTSVAAGLSLPIEAPLQAATPAAERLRIQRLSWAWLTATDGSQNRFERKITGRVNKPQGAPEPFAGISVLET
jgi:hypothetical protein